MLTIRYQTTFKRDYKRLKKRGYDMAKLEHVISLLAYDESKKELNEEYADHALKGMYSGLRECHIAPDWVLIYEISKNQLILYLTRTGTHSDLFKK